VVAKAWRARWPPEDSRAWPWRALQFKTMDIRHPGRG
jgi:hypothetical protein